jgi:hypothetical protein
MDNYKEFNHLILLIGTNPLPNFVAADYFLQNNKQLQTVWLLHSEENRLQAGTHEQVRNLEALLRKRWQGNHANLRFPLEKISLTDVSDAATILREIETKMLRGWQPNQSFHLNYTGGTKAMSTHVYRRLQELGKRGQHQCSYLDANNFRLVVDDYGVAVDDLRKKVQVTFDDLISLHGFQKVKAKNGSIDKSAAIQAYRKFLDVQNFPSMKGEDGGDFEKYIFLMLGNKFRSKLTNGGEIQHNWLIKYPTWQVYFELDIIMLNGYHLTGISCTVSSDKQACKSRGFEIILRTRQIGGDEARAILISRSNRNQAKILQDELAYETGGNQQNILVLGVDDLRQEEIYLRKIEKFVFE